MLHMCWIIFFTVFAFMFCFLLWNFRRVLQKIPKFKLWFNFIISSDGFTHILKSLWIKYVPWLEVNSSCTLFLLAIHKSLIGTHWQKAYWVKCWHLKRFFKKPPRSWVITINLYFSKAWVRGGKIDKFSLLIKSMYTETAPVFNIFLNSLPAKQLLVSFVFFTWHTQDIWKTEKRAQIRKKQCKENHPYLSFTWLHSLYLDLLYDYNIK